MPLVPYDPFRHMDQWRKDFDKFFNTGVGLNQDFITPRVDVHENEKEVIATCEIPGLNSKEDVHIHVDDNMLIIHGAISRNNEIKENQMHRKERFIGRFERAIALPSRVQAEGTTASYKNGILEVRMLKSTQDQSKRIDVQFH